ncbi:MAG TPA: cache domain-containing protein, partial [Candidatus Sericytochromatia bacterium]
MIPPLNKKSTLALLILTVAAYAGNYFKLPLFFGLDFLFGSIFVLIALRLFGLFWGTLTAIIAAVYTVILWNHPYAAVILICEALFVGLLSRRHSHNILLVDGIYWIFIGIPLVWVFYHLVLHVDTTQTFLVLFKQSVNGIFNALLANLILTYLPIHKWISRPQIKKTLSIKQTSLNLLVAFVFFPVLMLTVFDSQRIMSSITNLVTDELQSTSTDIISDLGNWHEHRVYALQELAKIAENSEGKLPAENAIANQLQQSTELLEKAFADFNNLYVTNSAGNIIAAYPKFNDDGRSNIGINVANQNIFKQTKTKLQPLLTNVYRDKVSLAPHVGLSVPIIANGKFRGLVYVSWELSYISRRISSKIENKQLQITLVDQAGSIIATNQREKTVIEKFKRPQNGEIKSINNSIYQWLPDPGEVPPVVRWKNSFYVQETLIGDKIPWKLIVEAPAAPYVKDLQDIYIKDLAIMLLVAIAAMILAELVSRKLVSPIESLADVTTNLPAKILDREAITWPHSLVAEID